MYLESYPCVLCVENLEEDIAHLFFDCPFNQTFWLYLDIQWDTSLDPQYMFIRAREIWVRYLQRGNHYNDLDVMVS